MTGARGAGVGAALVALLLAGACAWGGATGPTGRVAFALASTVVLASVAWLVGQPSRCARATGAERAGLALAAWAGLGAVPWPSGLVRALAPLTAGSQAAALGVPSIVAPSLDPGATARAALALAGVVFVAMAVRAVCERGGLRWLLRATTLVALAVAAAGLARGRYGEDEPLLFGLSTSNPLNAYGPFANRGHFAAAVLLACAGPVGLLARPRAWADRWLGALALVAAGAAVVASGSRAGAVGIVVGGVAALTCAGRGGRRLALVTAVLGAGVVGGALLGVAPFASRLPVRADEAARLEIWRGTVALVAEQPVVGVGLDAFRYAYPGDGRGPVEDWVAIAENDVLQVVAETGVVGLAGLALAAALALRALGRDRRAAGAGGVPRRLALAPCAAVLPLVATATPLHAPAVAAAAVVAFGCARGLVRGEADPAVRG